MIKDFPQKVEEYVNKILDERFYFERKKVSEDWLKKPRLAEGIVNDFENRATKVQGKKVLDIGFGNGVTLAAFIKRGAIGSGLEVSQDLFDFGKWYISQSGIDADLRLYDGFNFPYNNESFDCIYSVSVFEHTDDPQKLVQEASRVLKKGGLFYLAFPNRLKPKETHTGIWFASYLPRKLAGTYLKMMGRNGVDDYWNLHFLSYFQLKKWLKNSDNTFKIRFETDSGSGFRSTVKKILAMLGIHQSAFLPHVMVVLEKE